MKSILKPTIALVLAAFLAIATLLPFPSKASEAGRRNTTYALGALTGVLALKHKWVPAAVAAVGTGVAYHNYQAAVNARHRRQARISYRHAYRSGYTTGYRVHRHRVIHHRRRR